MRLWMRGAGSVLGGLCAGALFFGVCRQPPKAPKKRAQPNVSRPSSSGTGLVSTSQKVKAKGMFAQHKLFRQAQEEAAQGERGSAWMALTAKKAKFPLRAHLIWLLAEGLQRRGLALAAAQHYRSLLDQGFRLWPKALLYARLSVVYQKAGQQQLATQFLRKSLRRRRQRAHMGWYRRTLTRLETAHALYLSSEQSKGTTQHQQRAEVWLDYPESPWSVQAERQWWKQKNELDPPRSRHQWRLWIRAIERYLHEEHNLSRAKSLLRILWRTKPRGKKRVTLSRLEALWTLRKRGWRRGYRSYRSYLKKLSRRRRDAAHLYIAQLALARGKRRVFFKHLKKMRRARRYWRGYSAVAVARRNAKRGKWRKAYRTYNHAWRYWRSKKQRAQLLYEQGLVWVGRRRYRKAARWFANAAKKRKNWPALRYWQARVLELRRKRKRASAAYLKILASSRLDYYTLLAQQRLRVLGKMASLPFQAVKPSPWFPGEPRSTQHQRFALLARLGASSLLLLELEAYASQQRSLPKKLQQSLTWASLKAAQPQAAIGWASATTSSRTTSSLGLLQGQMPAVRHFGPAFNQLQKQCGVDRRSLLALYHTQPPAMGAHSVDFSLAPPSVTPNLSQLGLAGLTGRRWMSFCRRLGRRQKRSFDALFRDWLSWWHHPHWVRRRAFRRAPAELAWAWDGSKVQHTWRIYWLYPWLHLGSI